MIGMLLGLLLGLNGLDQAEQAYQVGQFHKAYALYEQALAGEENSQGPLWYNLGLCAYRLERPAEALLFFKRALERMPRDPELRFNLEFVEQELRIERSPYQSFGAAFHALLGRYSAGELLLGVALIQILGLGSLILLRLGSTMRKLVVLLLLFSLTGTFYLAHARWIDQSIPAVVLAREIPVWPEPHTDLDALFDLEAGETVSIHERSTRWARISHPEGQGWIQCTEIGIVE